MVTNVQITPVDNVVVVSLEMAKKHLRLDEYETPEGETVPVMVAHQDDDLVQLYIDAAVSASENYIGGNITESDLVITVDRLDNPFIFEAFPLIAVSKVSYFPEGAPDSVDFIDTDYKLTKVNSKITSLHFLQDLPRIDTRYDAATVTAKIGFPADEVPKPIIAAILLQVADLYERREDRAATISTAAMALLRPYKKF